MAKNNGCGRLPLSHSALHRFVTTFDLDHAIFWDRPDRRRVGVVLPDCPEMVVLLMAIMNCASAVPINGHMTADEVIEELDSLHVRVAIVGQENSATVGAALAQRGIIVMTLVRDVSVIGLFSVKPLHSSSGSGDVIQPVVPDVDDEPAEGVPPHELSSEALVLRTSGTSGKKKTVGYKLNTLILGSTQVAKSWGLTESDACLNMMPLYHVGGIVRNMLAPLLAGGGVIVTSGFDPIAFWDIVEAAGGPPTWYYAVPTMHMGILDEGRRRYGPSMAKPSGIRLISNAGGGLAPSLAVELREFFAGATVLPSYGMTECMPIATPPLDYKLERPGTSGISTGVEIAVYNSGELAKPHVIGHVCVRGPPLFDGYDGDAKATELSFNSDGFFDTGDLGYLDEDGYLFITGRSKEVINRGGEIISPVEIEDAVRAHAGVKDVIAFVVPHKTLQETVGIVIVPASPAQPRVGLQEIQRFVAASLHPSKWPQVVVYMDDIPKNLNNKPLRINLAKRLNLAEQEDSTPPFDRLFEATCPPRTTPLSEPIPCQPVNTSPDELRAALEKKIPSIADQVAFVHEKHFVLCFACKPESVIGADAIRAALVGSVHDYLVPTKFVPLGAIPRDEKRGGAPDFAALKVAAANTRELLTGDEKKLAEIFQEALGLESLPEADDDFFALGGSSLKAGFVVARIRKTFGASLPSMAIFSFRTPRALLAEVHRVTGGSQRSDSPTETLGRPEAEQENVHVASKSPVGILALIVQLLPLVVIRPLRTCATWLSFAYVLTLVDRAARKWNEEAEDIALQGPVLRCGMLIVALTITVTVLWVVLPFIPILSKWIIIGRYRAGRFPLWGTYYLRWWLVDQIYYVFGRGFFGVNATMLRLHARLMGAHIGVNVQINSSTKLGEFDLITIEDGCALDATRVRPFTMETGYMVLKPIVIARDCVLNAKCVVAPGHRVPSGTVLPPLSSSYEIQDAHDEFAPYCRATQPAPHFLAKAFVGFPIVALVTFFSYLPWLGVIYRMASMPFDYGDLNLSIMGHIIVYFAADFRVAYHMLAMAVKHTVSPFLKLFAAILVKRYVVGKFQPGPCASAGGPPPQQEQSVLIKRWIMDQLLGDGDLCGVYHLVGRHYGIISVIYRLLGAKVGKRIYWPGTPMKIYEHDLLEVGDDVVFGSRSDFIFTSAEGSRRIEVQSGAMVADRCVLLGGAVVGRNAVLGSGSLARANTTYPDGSVWLGSQGGGAVLWTEGTAEEAAADTLKPFGRAFYQRKASFFVYPLWAVVVYNVFLQAMAAMLRTTPAVVGVIVAAYEYRVAFYRWFQSDRTAPIPDPTGLAVVFFVGSVMAAFLGITVFTTALDVTAKWALFGRRKDGGHDWDKSSYCQRWQVYLSLLEMRIAPLQLVRGSIYLVLYFRALGCRIGKRVCLYPTGSDPMMTEPDLVRLGDDVCVDVASVVAHINSKGLFSLNPMTVGARSVLRAESRVLSGAQVESDATLLEHTLIVSGDVVDRGATMQGWPANEFDHATVDASRRSPELKQAKVF
ncbi:acetyl-CoA synthetase-like protein [Zopfochytrium polystomum]|nr:acetyl-CoA synthetase-like protein [Zopfochytrium polystomum]